MSRRAKKYFPLASQSGCFESRYWLDLCLIEDGISMSALPLVSVLVPLVDALNLGMAMCEVKQGTTLFCAHGPVGFKIYLKEGEVPFP